MRCDAAPHRRSHRCRRRRAVNHEMRRRRLIGSPRTPAGLAGVVATREGSDEYGRCGGDARRRGTAPTAATINGPADHTPGARRAPRQSWFVAERSVRLRTDPTTASITPSGTLSRHRHAHNAGYVVPRDDEGGVVLCTHRALAVNVAEAASNVGDVFVAAHPSVEVRCLTGAVGANGASAPNAGSVVPRHQLSGAVRCMSEPQGSWWARIAGAPRGRTPLRGASTSQLLSGSGRCRASPEPLRTSCGRALDGVFRASRARQLEVISLRSRGQSPSVITVDCVKAACSHPAVLRSRLRWSHSLRPGGPPRGSNLPR